MRVKKIEGQLNLFDILEMEYKLEGAYIKIFKVKKFRNYIRDGKRKEVIGYMAHFGNYNTSMGWSEINHTIISFSPKGIQFNGEDKIYPYEDVADMLIQRYRGS